MVAVRIGPDWRLVAVVSPSYFESHPVPTTSQKLVHHIRINRRLDRVGGLYGWEFEKDKEKVRARVEGQLTFNTGREMAEAALLGNGIAFVPESYIERHVAEDRLRLVLYNWTPTFAGYYLYYPSRRQRLPAFSVIDNALRETSI